MQAHTNTQRGESWGPGMACRTGFTLVELLVVVAIIGVLMGILIPALAGARLTARSTVGVANLRSLSQMVLLYEQEQQSFPMPFDPQTHPPLRRVPGSVWSDALRPGADTPVWNFEVPIDPQWSTELFAAYWYSWLSDWHAQGGRDSEVQFSPADRLALDQLAQHRSNRLVRNGQYLWPSSFYLSPTLWSTPDRFGAGVRGAMGPGTLLPTAMSSVSHPQQKVMLWERADFAQTKRVAIDGRQAVRQNQPPSWCNPQSKPFVATVDGSVQRADVFRLAQAATQSRAYVPGGEITPSDLMPLYPPRLPDRLEPLGGSAGTDGRYPLYFWATNGGVRGVDLPR